MADVGSIGKAGVECRIRKPIVVHGSGRQMDNWRIGGLMFTGMKGTWAGRQGKARTDECIIRG